MDLYNPKYLHCVWDNSLKGENVFFGDCISTVIADVNRGEGRSLCLGYSEDKDYPFKMGGANFTFVYYDPNYDVKVAYYQQHKAVQYMSHVACDWRDCTEPCWNDDYKFRVKPVPELRPYGSVDELVDAYRKKYSIPKNTMPFMWLLNKSHKQQSMVVGVDFETDHVKMVLVNTSTIGDYSMAQVMRYYTFLDGSPCGWQAEE